MVVDGGSMRTFDLAQSNSEFAADELARSNIENESVLESILHANPQVLLDETVFIFGRQTSVESGILDLLGLDQYGNLLIFELKIGQSGSGSASEETILSQPQNYAQDLASCTYDRLNDIYQQYREDVASGQWSVSDAATPAQDLASAFEAVFGDTLDPEDFNAAQRIVIVAEQITSQTRQNTRYLLDKGLDMQCAEVQMFESEAAGQTVLGTNTVVDYSLSRVRPERESNPTYPDVARTLAELVSPRLSSVVGTDSSRIVFQDLDGYRPYFASPHPDHPADVRYTLYFRPATWGSVLVAIDYFGDDAGVLDALGQNSDLFAERGFTVKDRSRDRIVVGNWETDSPGVLNDEDFLAEVADEFVKLVETGHEVLVTND
ncbi:hypothetical protein [Halovenus salina]|nr:hypothetical protein [Halovenus salina]